VPHAVVDRGSHPTTPRVSLPAPAPDVYSMAFRPPATFAKRLEPEAASRTSGSDIELVESVR